MASQPSLTLAQDAAKDAQPLVGLCELERGGEGVIVRLEVQGDVRGRLLDLGFVPGTEVRLLRRAPLGDPILFELRGSSICLRRSEAREILVRALPPPRT